MTGKRGSARWARALLVAVPAVTALFAVTPSASAATTVPYTDPGASGYIGLCDQRGHQITSGRVDAAPFVWRAVSSVPAPPSYNGAGRTAALLGYLAMKALPPGDWSGELLTASTRYSNPLAPTAQATGRDESLSALMSDFPAQWEGFYELRIYLGAPDRETYEVKYPALNIQVKGDEWHAVGGGPVNCQASTAESIESILLPKTGTTATTSQHGPTASPTTAGRRAAGAALPGAAAGGHTGGTGNGGGAGGTGNGGASGGAGGGTAIGATVSGPAQAAAAISRKADPSTGPTHGSDTVAPVLVAGLAVIAVAVGAGGYLARRRRRANPPRPSEPSIAR
jgi:hypothetical protein